MASVGGTQTDVRWAIVALFDDLEVGTTFLRSAWPAHVTLASNFATDASADDLVRAVVHVSPPARMRIDFAAGELFGRSADIPVQLVRPEGVSSLHRRLADQLEQLPGFVADDPEFWRDGYRPHVTLAPSIRPIEGTSWTTSSVVIARLIGATAKIAGRGA